MNLHRTRVIAALLAACFLMPGMLQAQQKTAIQNVADAIGELLRAATGEAPKARPARRAIPAAPVMAAEAFAQPEVPADKLKQREERLQSYCNAMTNWLASECELTAEQLEAVEKLNTAAVAEQQESFRGGQNRANQGRGLSDTFPVQFTANYGVAESMDLTRHPKRLSNILNETQHTELSQAAEKRLQFHTDAIVARVLGLLDEELFLTPDQREGVTPMLRERLKGMESTSFSFNPQTYYMKQTSLSFVLTKQEFLKQLSEKQQLRAKALATNSSNRSTSGSEQYISFSSTEGIDGWLNKLKEAVVAQRQRVTTACALRAEFYRSIANLADSDARRLEIAGKGVAEELVADWKKMIRRQLQTYEEQMVRINGNFSFSMQVVDLRQIDSNDLWVHTVESLSAATADAAANRELRLRQDKARFLTALIDKELWLRPEQVQAVEETVEQCLPDSTFQSPYRTYMDDVAQLVVPLFKVSKVQETKLFDKTQRTAWAAAKNHFEFNGRYVIAHMENGGQFHFNIPK